MGTAKVAIGSELKRKAWMREGIVQAASTSFWGPYTGNSADSIVYQENDISAGEGHTVVFDFSGKLSGKAIKGEDTAYGKGEIKRKFSDKLTVDVYRIPVKNGRKFDGVDIGDLSINEYGESIEDLRQKSYKYFPLKKSVELTIETDNRYVKTTGYVESNEPNIFSSQEGSLIFFIWSFSYFF